MNNKTKTDILAEGFLSEFFILPGLIGAFYLSPNELSNDAAEEYCQLQCNSHLSTFHNFEDYVNAVHTIKGTSLIHSKDIWIGLLHDNETNQLRWADSTPFNFENHLDFESNEHCVVLSPSSDYRLQSKQCYEKHLFLCNSCALTIHKYIISTQMMNHSQANTRCNTQFGTSLASIHGVTDHNEAKLLCALATNTENKSCWIGLNDIENEGEYEWMDNTTFDFGTNLSRGVYPWSNDVLKQPNAYTPSSDCVDLWRNDEYDIDSFDFNDDNCNIIQPFLCNAPSTLCHQEDWYSSSMNWVFDEDSCDLYGVNDDAIVDALWMNVIQETWKGVIVDYMFTILHTQTYMMNGSGALNIRLLDVTHALDDDYYVIAAGFMVSNGVDVDLFLSYNGSVLKSVRISGYTIGSFYALKVLVTEDEGIKVYTNDKLYIEYDIHLLHLPTQYIIRSIAIQNDKLSTHSKSLYISGTEAVFISTTQTPETTQNAYDSDDDDHIHLSVTVPPPVLTQTVIPDPYNAYERKDNTASFIKFSVRDLALLLFAVVSGTALLFCALCCGVSYLKKFCIQYSMKQKLAHMSDHGAMHHMPQHSSVDITLETENVLQRQQTSELDLDLSDIKENNDQYLKVEQNDLDYDGAGMSSFDEYVTKGSQIINILNIPLPKTPNNIRSESVNSLPSSEGYMSRKRRGYDIIRLDPDNDANDEMDLAISDVSDVFGSSFQKETDNGAFEDMNHIASVSEFTRGRR